ncbi:MAG: molybdopterin-dependent oxidoreductase [Thermomicrobiales bacterium]
MVPAPATFTARDLKALPMQKATVDFQSGNGPLRHTSTGALLWDVLDKAHLQPDPNRKKDRLRKYIVLTAKDGYEVVISLGEIDLSSGNSWYLLAWEEDGKSLSGDDGPVRLVTPGDVKGGRYVYGVVTIAVRDIDSPPRS